MPGEDRYRKRIDRQDSNLQPSAPEAERSIAQVSKGSLVAASVKSHGALSGAIKLSGICNEGAAGVTRHHRWPAWNVKAIQPVWCHAGGQKPTPNARCELPFPNAVVNTAAG